MEQYIERTFGAVILQWGEPDDDGESYAVLWHGQLVRASSPSLLLGALRDLRGDWQVAA